MIWKWIIICCSVCIQYINCFGKVFLNNFKSAFFLIEKSKKREGGGTRVLKCIFDILKLVQNEIEASEHIIFTCKIDRTHFSLLSVNYIQFIVIFFIIYYWFIAICIYIICTWAALDISYITVIIIRIFQSKVELSNWYMCA